MIRAAKMEDMPRLLEIYALARVFMRSYGNDAQWTGVYPGEDILCQDIGAERLFVIIREDQIVGCFMMGAGPDPTYLKIYGGQWACDKAYCVIHRIASDGSVKGLLAEAVAYAKNFYSYIRIDTHEKNLPMRKALAKQGFTHRGTIYIADGSARMAFDWICPSHNES